MKTITATELVNIGTIAKLHGEMIDCLSGDAALSFDASSLTHGDLTLVQLLISASKSSAGQGRILRVIDPAGVIRASFTRCGVKPTIVDTILAA